MGSKTLFVTDFPIYTITPCGKRRVVITGGGGSAKTGVPNALELYEVLRDEKDIVSHVLHRHDFTTELAMNAASHPHNPEHIAVGVDNKCHILKLYQQEVQLIEKENNNTVQKRKGAESEAVEEVKKEQFNMDVTQMEQTDFCEVDAFQKAVCFSHNGAHVITGGADGCVRCWKFPGLKMMHELKGHKKEVDALACHPDNNMVASVSRDGHMIIWDTDKGQLVKSCDWQLNKKSVWRMRSCRFGKTREGDIFLFTINIPVSLPNKAQRLSYLCRWSAETWEVDRKTPYKGDMLTALAVSGCGQFLAVGSASGDVTLYSKNLKLLTKAKGTHSLFVTSLCFLSIPSSQGCDEPAVLSVSADKSCAVTSLARSSSSLLFKFVLLLLIVMIILTIMLLW